MKTRERGPESFRPGPNHDRITVQGIELAWHATAGTCTFQGLPVAMMWVDSTLAGLLSGVAAMVGPERFSLALQSEGRKSVEADWALMSRYPDFRAGFGAIGIVAAVAGWGEWQFTDDAPGRRECRFRAYNTWEGQYQKKLGVSWGSAMLAGKLAGYCSKRFGTNCWATQTAFIAKGDACDEFIVAPAPRRRRPAPPTQPRCRRASPRRPASGSCWWTTTFWCARDWRSSCRRMPTSRLSARPRTA